MPMRQNRLLPTLRHTDAIPDNDLRQRIASFEYGPLYPVAVAFIGQC